MPLQRRIQRKVTCLHVPAHAMAATGGCRTVSASSRQKQFRRLQVAKLRSSFCNTIRTWQVQQQVHSGLTVASPGHCAAVRWTAEPIPISIGGAVMRLLILEGPDVSLHWETSHCLSLDTRASCTPLFGRCGWPRQVACGRQRMSRVDPPRCTGQEAGVEQEVRLRFQDRSVTPNRNVDRAPTHALHSILLLHVLRIVDCNFRRTLTREFSPQQVETSSFMMRLKIGTRPDGLEASKSAIHEAGTSASCACRVSQDPTHRLRLTLSITDA